MSRAESDLSDSFIIRQYSIVQELELLVILQPMEWHIFLQGCINGHGVKEP
jgi:hypothetical protein